MSTPIEASDAHPPCHATRLIDHTLIKSGALFQELLGFYRSLSDGRRNWALSDLNRLQFRVELICLLSVAMSPALRHGHIPVTARILQLQVFCDMVTHAGRLVLCEAKPFIAITAAGRARWLLLDLGLFQLARFVHLRGSDLGALAPSDAGRLNSGPEAIRTPDRTVADTSSLSFRPSDRPASRICVGPCP